MELHELKKYISGFPEGKLFNYGISKPFSWRGSYDEVAFSIVEESMTREEILANIELAYTKTFYGYKGGEYQYNDYLMPNAETVAAKTRLDITTKKLLTCCFSITANGLQIGGRFNAANVLL